MADVVFLWVDGGAPPFIAERRVMQQLEPSIGAAIDGSERRNRDNGELHHALRAAWKNPRFVRRFIVVTNGRRPRFTDFSPPRIEFVAHREFFAPEAALPTFHATAIQTRLQNIPGLSESDVIVDDGTFVSKATVAEELLWSDGAGETPISSMEGAADRDAGRG